MNNNMFWATLVIVVGALTTVGFVMEDRQEERQFKLELQNCEFDFQQRHKGNLK